MLHLCHFPLLIYEALQVPWRRCGALQFMSNLANILSPVRPVSHYFPSSPCASQSLVAAERNKVWQATGYNVSSDISPLVCGWKFYIWSAHHTDFLSETSLGLIFVINRQKRRTGCRSFLFTKNHSLVRAYNRKGEGWEKRTTGRETYYGFNGLWKNNPTQTNIHLPWIKYSFRMTLDHIYYISPCVPICPFQDLNYVH